MNYDASESSVIASVLLPFCAVQTPPPPPKTREEKRERERERRTNQHYPAIKRRLLSTVRSFFSSQVALHRVAHEFYCLSFSVKPLKDVVPRQPSRTSVPPTSIRNICIINRAPHAVPISSTSSPVYIYIYICIYTGRGGDNKHSGNFKRVR